MERLLQDHCTEDSIRVESDTTHNSSMESGNKHQRIAFIQYGDFFLDATRLGFGGPETYVAQRSSVARVERLTQQYAGIMVLCLRAGPYERDLPSGVHCVGVPNDALARGERRQLLDVLQSWAPTTIVLQTPLRYLLAHCINAKWRVLPMLADSFRDTRLRRRLSYWRLARVLNHSSVDFVGNHQVPACQDLVRIGVDPAKIVPWDLPSETKPTDYPVKSGVRSRDHASVVYVGSVSEWKGVGDLIKAVAQLNRSNVRVNATVVGKGDIDRFRQVASYLGVADRINFAGLIPHSQVIPVMQQHDMVVIPSRHTCPEGLPFTIFEALTSRSPLIVSDHPMFLKRLEDGRNALVFRESDSVALAACLRRLIHDNELFARLSGNSADAWQRLQIPVSWGTLLERWLASGPENIRWLQNHTLARYQYE